MQQSFSTVSESSRPVFGDWLSRHRRKSTIGFVAVLIVLCLGVAASALPHSDTDPIGNPVASDGQNSAMATRLVDGKTGPTANYSWSNATNEWQNSYYPMEAVIDLGADYHATSLRYFAGEIPYPQTASLTIESASSAQPDNFSPLAVVTSPRYDQWSAPILVDDESVRYLRVRFDSVSSHFKLAELQVFGHPWHGSHGDSDDYLANLVASDEQNSSHAARLVDQTTPGTTAAHSWLNPGPWNNSNYPMSAVIDLGGSHSLAQIDYFVGEISEGTDKINFEYTNQLTPSAFAPLATVDSGHRWNNWSSVTLKGEEARFVRVRFDSPLERFNVSELRVSGQAVGDTSTSGSDVISGQDTMSDGHDHGDHSKDDHGSDDEGDGVIAAHGNSDTTSDHAGHTDSPSNDSASNDSGSSESGSTNSATNDGHAGHVGMNDADAPAGGLPAAGTPVLGSTEDLPQASVPPAGVDRSFQFGVWPGDHLTDTCRELHDRYWVQGPDGAAYPTWHPALITNPETGETCDIGHEHGTDPSVSPVFEASGGWPAFGYAAAEAAAGGGHRHEDHVGHKVSVAHFRAAIGNGGGSETMYDAGFECDWLSKIHQGSFSMDAFANHLHEYFLTLRCLDGLNSAGVMDGNTVGTDFSVKVVYTYGNPDEFVEKSCSGADQTYSASILTGPDGQPAPGAMQQTPTGLDSPNNRGFSCASGVIWKPMSEVREVDLWTELVKIQRNDGQTALTIQPYYQIKNPARIIAPFDRDLGEQPSSVVRTIDLCYDDSGAKITKYSYCADAPNTQPTDWRDPASPFNGTLRAINFKSSSLNNGGGPTEFCTNAFGRRVQDTPPCDSGNILQKASSFDNNWNNGQYSYGQNTGHIAGSIWADNPHGDRFESKSNGNGGYNPAGIGFEFIIDNRDPDDNFDGVPDGANIRGEN